MKMFATLVAFLMIAAYADAQCSSCGSGGGISRGFSMSMMSAPMQYSMPMQYAAPSCATGVCGQMQGWQPSYTPMPIPSPIASGPAKFTSTDGVTYYRGTDGQYRRCPECEAAEQDQAKKAVAGCPCTCGCKDSGKCVCGKKASVDAPADNQMVRAKDCREKTLNPGEALYQLPDGSLIKFDRAAMELAQKGDAQIMPAGGKWVVKANK